MRSMTDSGRSRKSSNDSRIGMIVELLSVDLALGDGG